jgi:hypothetical protein
MSRSQLEMHFEDEPIEAEIKPNRLAVMACRTWGYFCAVMLALCIVMEAMKLGGHWGPVRWRDIVAWVCFDALFLLGAYSGFQFLCDSHCDVHDEE